MYSNWFRSYCSDSFWDPEQIWHTDHPRLSRCTRNAVFTCIPFLILWFFTPFEITFVVKRKSKAFGWNVFNTFRLFICLLLFLVQVAELVLTLDYFFPHSNTDIAAHVLLDVVSPLLKCFTTLLLSVIFIYHRKYGIRNSGFIWIFLLITVLFQSPIILDIHFYNGHAYPLSEYILIHATYALLFTLLVLNSFVDKHANVQPTSSNVYEISTENEQILKTVDQNRQPSPEPFVSFLNCITFSWFSCLVSLGYKKPLVTDDLWSMKPSDKIVNIVARFRQSLNHEINKVQQKKKLPAKTPVRFSQCLLLFALIRTYGVYFLFGALGKFVFDLLQFVNPMLLSLLISFTKDTEAKRWHGFLIAVAMLTSSTVQSVIINFYFRRMFLVAIKTKSSLVDLIYRKSLRLSSTARRDRTTGEIVNLLSVDSHRFMDVLPYMNLIWSAPLQIVLSIYFLYKQLGVSVFAGVGVILLMIPINSVVVNISRKIQLKQMKQKDERIKLINEILNGIKVIKFYGWEGAFLDKVQQVRQKEVDNLKRFSYLGSVTAFFFNAAPLLVSLSTFGIYIWIDPSNQLTPEKAFVSLALFNILQFPLTLMPQVINNILMASVSLQRIVSFLNADEIVPYITRNPDDTNAIDIRDKVNFKWDANDMSKNGHSELKSKMSNSSDNSVKYSTGASENVSNKEEAKVDLGVNASNNSNQNGKSNAKSNKNGSSGYLQDISVQIKHGSLVAVVGSVGCGKSSFLSALLGEMNAYRNDNKTAYVNIAAGLQIAYAPQQAWIQNATVRDNILFGQEMDELKYKKIINACALKPDLKLLPAGDQTEIGEKGINLSGGQKQRVNLARLCYSDSNLLFLDDPLSALDAHVSKHIFKQVIGSESGLLKDKTRILVTNQLPYLKHVDQILVLDQGRIALNCTYDELQAYAAQHGYAALEKFGIQLKAPDSKAQQPNADVTTNVSTDETITGNVAEETALLSVSSKSNQSKLDSKSEELKSQQGKLIDNEKVEVDVVKIRDYFTYLSNFGFWFALFTLLGNIMQHSLSLASNVWLSQWSNGPTNMTPDVLAEFNYNQLSVYGLLGLLQSVVMLIAFYVLILGALRASLQSHSNLFWHVIRSPMSFFDTTPIGRIVNRFSRDIDTIDSSIPPTLRTFINCMLRIATTFVIIVYKTPEFTAILLPSVIIYYFIQKYYVATTRQLKRLDSITRSPIYSHFSETLSGCSTIRAYSKCKAFANESNARVELNNICYYPSMIANRWLSIRLEFLGNIMVFSTAIFAVYGKDYLDAGTVGLIISYAINVTQVLSWQVRMISELETNLVSVERINEYNENELEDDWIKPNRPPSDWPKEGVVEFKNYTTTYRKGMEPVLKDINLKIDQMDKIGIVGRTGAGKSTITLALFRIIEPIGGRILIDGIDINQIGLHDLRSKLAIIPQDPMLFSGTVRFNLDPFNQHTDEQIWKVLQLSHLRDFVNEFASGLQHQVAEGGDNLSVGQRQLICLARALLKNAKILILDEATASVDYVTDSLIQETIRNEFSQATTITIAHRINTILDSTKILVLDKGTVKEYDKPEVLLDNNDSLFYSLAKSAEVIRK